MLVFIIVFCVAALTVLIACFWRQTTRQLAGNSLIRCAWHPNCGTSREIEGFHIGVPGKSDLLGSDPLSLGSLTMNTSRYFEPSGNTRPMTRCRFWNTVTFMVHHIWKYWRSVSRRHVTFRRQNWSPSSG